MNEILLKNTLEVEDSLDLSQYGATIQIPRKQIIYSPDKPTISAFYVKQGCVRLVNSQNGTIKVVSKGQFFGDRSIFYSKNVYAEALTDVEVVGINNDAFQKMFQQDVKLALRITSDLSNILGGNDRTSSRMVNYFTKIKHKYTKKLYNDECHC